MQNMDVFKSYLLHEAQYDPDDPFRIPKLRSSKLTPNKLLPFSQAVRTTDYRQWVHFYEPDEQIIRVLNNPKRYLPILQKFYGVISFDLSVQRNMPRFMKANSIGMSRALGNFWQQNGIEVIPNVRFNGADTYDIAFSGIDKFSNIAIGTLGCLRNREDRQYFIEDLEEMMKRLQPKNLIVYGDMPDSIFGKYQEQTNLIHFPSWISVVHGRCK